MRDWFESLEPRERVMVSIAGVFIVFAIYWFALWQPLARGTEDLDARIDDWRLAIAELAPLAGQLDSGAAQPVRTARTQSLVVIVDNTLREHELYPSLQRSQPTNTNGIRVEFSDIAFDDLVLWLGELASQYGLHVQSASFSQGSTNNPGRINASLTLERG